MPQFGPEKIISANVSLETSAPGGFPLTNPDLLPGDRFATFMHAEHLDAFHAVIKPVMASLVVASAAETPHRFGRTVKSSVFGISFGDGYYQDRQTELFVPNVHRDFLYLLGDNPMDAIHGYHRQVIGQINDALATVSPYRLEPLL